MVKFLTLQNPSQVINYWCSSYITAGTMEKQFYEGKVIYWTLTQSWLGKELKAEDLSCKYTRALLSIAHYVPCCQSSAKYSFFFFAINSKVTHCLAAAQYLHTYGSHDLVTSFDFN